MAANSPSNPSSSALDALLRRAAFAPATAGWLRVTGEDRVRWLNGMVTNSIQALAPGEGCYNFVLSAQGRIQGDLLAWMREDSVLLETSRPGALATWLDRYIIMDDVELTMLRASQTEAAETISSERAGVGIAGPHAASVLSKLLPGCSLPEPLHFVSAVWQNTPIELFHGNSPLVPRFELWSDRSEAIDQITSALRAVNIPQASSADLEDLRLLEGTPLYGADIRDKELPQETAQSRALHFSKGCYLGQEIVERIHSRGAVHRTFSGFTLEGEMPTSGTALASAEAPEKSVGEITSAARIELPGGPVTIALGYIRRDALDGKSVLVYPGGSATPASLPFTLAAQDEPGLPQTASEPAAVESAHT